MKLSNWMIAGAIIEGLFGIGLLIMPETVGGMFGMSLDVEGALMAKLFGTALIFSSMVRWLARHESAAEPAVQGIMLSIVVADAIGFIITFWATITGIWNVLGWVPVGLYLVFGLVFAAFRFGRQAA